MNCCNNALYSIHRGDTDVIPVRFIANNKTVNQIAGINIDNVKLSVKRNQYDPKPIFTKNATRTDSEWLIKIETSDTQNLNFGDYIYDIEVNGNGLKKTIIFGVFRILGEVTG